jgi:signal transduction histidine kinase
MQVKEALAKRRRDFDTVICLTGVIPFLVFVYLLIVRVANLQILVGEIGYIMFTTVVIFLLGILVGKKLFWSMITDVMERNRLSAIAETTLALSHEINNPLLTVRGNVELLQNDFAKKQIADDTIINRLETIKDHCERIRVVTDKLASLTNPVSTTVHGKTKMVDLSQSS